MNKYQETLNWLRESTVSLKHIRAYSTMQELVDKETPMKPINQYPIDFGLGNYGECSICNHGVNYQQNYCDKCGQKIDWRGEE